MPRNPKDNADSPKNYKIKEKTRKKKKAQESGSDSDSSSDYQPGDEVEDMNTLEMQKFIQKIFPSKSGKERLKQLDKIDKMIDKSPANTLFVLQSTNYIEVDQHINCSASLNDFVNRYDKKLHNIKIYEMELEKYKRFMLLGVKS